MAFIRKRLGASDRGMEAVIEADLDDAAARLGRGNKRRHFGRSPASRLLDKHVAAGFDGRQSDLCKLIVGRRDHDRIGVDADGLTPIRNGARRGLTCEPVPALGIRIADRDDLVGGSRHGPL